MVSIYETHLKLFNVVTKTLKVTAIIILALGLSIPGGPDKLRTHMSQILEKLQWHVPRTKTKKSNIVRFNKMRNQYVQKTPHKTIFMELRVNLRTTSMVYVIQLATPAIEA